MTITNDNIMSTEPVKIKENGRMLCRGDADINSSTSFRFYPTEWQREKILYAIKCFKNIEYKYIESRHNEEMVDTPDDYLKFHMDDLRSSYRKLLLSPVGVMLDDRLERIYNLNLHRSVSYAMLSKSPIGLQKVIRRPVNKLKIRVHPTVSDMKKYELDPSYELRYATERDITLSGLDKDEIKKYQDNSIIYIPWLGCIKIRTGFRNFTKDEFNRCKDIVIHIDLGPAYQKNGFKWYIQFCENYQSCSCNQNDDADETIDELTKDIPTDPKEMINYINNSHVRVDNPAPQPHIIKQKSYERRDLEIIEMRLLTRTSQADRFHYFMNVLNTIAMDFVSHRLNDINRYTVDDYMTFIFTALQMSVVTKDIVLGDGTKAYIYTTNFAAYIRNHRMPLYTIKAYLNSISKSIDLMVKKHKTVFRSQSWYAKHILPSYFEIEVSSLKLHSIPIEERVLTRLDEGYIRDKDDDKDVYIALPEEYENTTLRNHFTRADIGRIIYLTDTIGYIKVRRSKSIDLNQDIFQNCKKVYIAYDRAKDKWNLQIYYTKFRDRQIPVVTSTAILPVD